MLTRLACIEAGKPGGGTFLPVCGNSAEHGVGHYGYGTKVNGWGSLFQNDSQGYFEYGNGNFDGQGSGSNFAGTVWHPSHGYVNNCDGGRSHWHCDYRQR